MESIEQRLARLEQEVGKLRDAQALRALLSQYAIAVDDKRPALLRSIFTADASVLIPTWEVGALRPAASLLRQRRHEDRRGHRDGLHVLARHPGAWRQLSTGLGYLPLGVRTCRRAMAYNDGIDLDPRDDDGRGGLGERV